MKIRYLKTAKDEFDDAILYYKEEKLNLDKHFRTDVKTSITRITNFPKVYPFINKEIRKCVLHRFPYNILFSIQADCIIVIAIAHHHRKPNYWTNRF